jgi:4-azaleucine resistance transporter AzlC
MRSTWRTLAARTGPQTLHAIAMVCVADAVVGASFGAISVSGGLPLWVPVALSLLVFAGGAQFAAVGVVVAGGSPVAAVVAALVLNTRMVPFGFAVSDVLGSRRLPRMLGAHLMTDESVAFTLRHTDPRLRRAAYLTCGLGLFACWNVSVLVGALAGGLVRDTDAFGLDAAFPAVVLALVLPALRDPTTRVSAAVGAVVAVVSTPFLPAGLPLLLALVGVLVARRPRPPAVAAESVEESS